MAPGSNSDYAHVRRLTKHLILLISSLDLWLGL